MQFKWKSEKQFNFGVEIPNYEFHTNNKEALTPYVYFKRFFSDDIFDLIVQESNFKVDFIKSGHFLIKFVRIV